MTLTEPSLACDRSLSLNSPTDNLLQSDPNNQSTTRFTSSLLLRAANVPTLKATPREEGFTDTETPIANELPSGGLLCI